jgi:FHA domain-containing protein
VGARIVLSHEGAIVTEMELTKPVTVVGRHPASDICIDHPAVSGRHMLFRIAGTTVYVEDLASTNGTKVNGHATEGKVVHHLDLIEVGTHKLHFFDDAMLAGGVGIENTVLTDFERTMIASHVPEAAPGARQASARRGDEDLSHTMAIPRDPSLKLGPAPEVVRAGEDEPAKATLALRVVEGGGAGEVVALDRANTMLGEAGGDTALVVRRGASFLLARFGGNRAPRLNRKELGPGAHPIAPNDVIEVGGCRFEVFQIAR